MHPLILTFAFLMLLAALVTGKIKDSISHSLMTSLFKNGLHLEENVASGRQTSLFYELKEAEGNGSPDPHPEHPKERSSEEKARALKFALSRPPNNSRLNLFHLDLPDTYATTAHLLRILYAKSPYMQQPNREYHLLDALKAHMGTIQKFEYPDELGEITLLNPYLQEMLSSFLKGHLDIDGKPLPSLLSFLTVEKKTKNINFLFAPPELIQALTHHDEATKKLLAFQKKYLETIIHCEEHRSEYLRHEGLTRTDIYKTLKTEIEPLLSSYHLDISFDYHLGYPGNILFVTDPITQITHREKVIEPR